MGDCLQPPRRVGPIGLFARGLMMVEQIAIDKGRCQFGWLLAGMVDPDLAQIGIAKELASNPMPNWHRQLG